MNSRSWEETLIFPNLERIYDCTEKINETEIVVRVVAVDGMKLLVKDSASFN